MDPDKSNRALGFLALIMGLCQFYRVLVAPSKVIQLPITRPSSRSIAPSSRRRARHHSSPETTSHRQPMWPSTCFVEDTMSIDRDYFSLSFSSTRGKRAR